MRIRMAVSVIMVLQAAVLAGEDQKTEPAAGNAPRRGRTLALFDTGEALPEPGAAQFQIEAEKWTKIAGAVAAGIKGDAVLCNQYAAVVVRKDGAGVDLYAQAAGLPDAASAAQAAGWVHRARLAPLAGGNAASFAGVASVPGDGSAVGVAVRLQDAARGTLEFSLAAESPLLKATAKGKADGMRISAPCRWGVLPDFFTDDMLVDARQISAARAELPIEHIYLQLLDNGNSILAIFCEKNERDIQVGLGGEGEQRILKETDVFFGDQGGSLWVGTMECRGIWHSRHLSKEENRRGVKLDWDVPFDASWKVNFALADTDVHSEGLNVLFGHQWLNWVGNAPKKGVVTIPGNPLGKKNLQGEGPLLVVYPLRRNDLTPLSAPLLDDFMRLSLGSGPCAYILDESGRKTQNRGIFTCSYAQMMADMMRGHLKDTSFWKEERGLLRLNNRAVLTFMEFIESRIGLYAEFRKEMLALLEEREKKHPDLAGFTAKVKELVSKLPEKAPRGSQRVAPGLQVMEKAILIDTPGQLAVSLNATSPVPQVAEPQDVQLAECRRTAKLLRARVVAEFVRNPALSKNPAAAAIVKEVREKSQALLHGPASHEGGETW